MEKPFRSESRKDGRPNLSGAVPDLIWNEDRVRGKVMSKDALTPQARYHFTRFDQVNQLVGASEADADLGFMARMNGALLTAAHQPRKPDSVCPAQWPVQANHGRSE